MYVLIYIVIIIVAFYACYKQPSVAFAFMLCTFSLEQWLQSKDVFFLVNNSLVNVINAIVILSALTLKQVREGKIFSDYPSTAWLIIALYCYAATSILWTPVQAISVANFYQNLPYIILSVLIAPLLIKNDEDLYQSFVFLIFFGGLLSILLLFFTEWGYRRISLVSNIAEGKTNPLAIANFAGYVMLSSILLNLRKEYKIWRVARWILVIVCLGIAVKTGSRGQFMLMIVLALLFLPISRPVNQLKRFIPLLVAVFFISGISYWALQEYTIDQTAKESARWGSDRMGGDISGRFDAAVRLIEVWYNDPQSIFFGLGSSASYDNSIFGFYTHIVPLEILGELGLIGFLLFTIILFKVYKIFWRCISKSKDNAVKRGVFATISAIVLFEFLLSFKQGSFLGSQILFGVILVLAKLEKSYVANDLIIEKSDLADNASKVDPNNDDIARVRLKKSFSERR